MDNTTPPTQAPHSQPRNTLITSSKYYLQKVWLGFASLWKWTAYAIGSLILAIIILLLIAGLFGGSSGGSVMANEQFMLGSGIDKIVVLPIEGIIGEAGSSILGGGVGNSAEMFRADLEQAQNDPLVKAIILSINSPGGSAVVSDQMYHYIDEFKRSSKKPVIASFGDTAASGGYYIASIADKIVANPASLTGSIGVIMEYYDASGLLHNVGVSPEVIKSGAYKDMGSFVRPTSDEERVILQSVVDEAYGQFVDRVAAGRDMEREKVTALADGRIYTGSQAKANGLVDELGNLSTAIDLAKDLAGLDEASVVKYEHGGWWDSVLGVSQALQPLSSLSKLAASTTTVSGLQYRWAP